MNSPKQNHDSKRLRELASAAMDCVATASQRQELTDILRNSESARDEYLLLVDLHATLAGDLASIKTPSNVNSSAPPSNSKPYLALAITLAASIAIAVWAFGPAGVVPDDQTIPQNIAQNDFESFGSIVQLTNVKWDAQSSPLNVGDRIGQGVIRIDGGFVRFEMDSGVEVTLQGPAEYELNSQEKTNLVAGLLTANVPPGAEGFTVTTPNAEVVDLGTSFGIDLRETGFSNVSVFDGEVEVAAGEDTEKRLLTEGDSVRIGDDQSIEDVTFDPEAYEKMWPVSSGIAGSDEVFRFLPPWSKRIRSIQSDHSIFVALEGYPVELNSELAVNISQPGNYANPNELTPAAIPTGQRVRSYILHFSPEKNVGVMKADRVTGSITFDRPILGLIVRHEELLDSMQRFGRRSAGETQPRRQLDLTNDLAGDQISLSEDRKTLTLDLISPGRSSDMVRVIVDGERFRHGRKKKNKRHRDRRKDESKSASKQKHSPKELKPVFKKEKK